MKRGHGFGDYSQDGELSRWGLGRDTKWRSCYAQKRLRNAKQGNHPNDATLPGRKLQQDVFDAIKAQDPLGELLGKAGFKIRRWCSNRPGVLRDVPVEDRVTNVIIEGSELPCMKALGVQWKADTYMFTFKIKPLQDVVYTRRRRGLFKEISYAVLQMLAPFTIKARIA